ncbi:hypothetical protein M501DRAFT_1015434 [Patellaria atrata CBS 101060]|uniref:Uncharacterized protein n=1 Tax=Patellaria atrata CBS 101060 TaxID=1346257 RepID=A0A9P4SEY9_9PEZI|nr:hypothetical protein M501DRAFT_1015434 [Patellaria atrata CBS 101060]
MQPRPNYILSKFLDPPFAILIGLSAALLRIHNVESSHGRTFPQTLETAKRRVHIAWEEKGR